MRAAHRLGNDPVDHFQPQQVLRGHLHRFGSVRSLFGSAPQDRSAAFGADHRIDRVFQHQHPFGAGQSHCATRAALAHHHRHHRRRQSQTSLGAAGNRLGLAAFLGLDPRKSARSVNQRHDRQAKTARQLHQADRLAIAFGLAHAEIVLDAGGGIVALFMADQHHPALAQPRETAQNGLILAIAAVSAQRHEVAEHPFDIVEEMRALRMAGDLRLLPRGQRLVDRIEQIGALALQPGDLAGKVQIAALGGSAQFTNARIKRRNRLFELEIGNHRCRAYAPRLGFASSPDDASFAASERAPKAEFPASGCRAFTSSTSRAESTWV